MNLKVLDARGLARPRAAQLQLGLLCVLYYVTIQLYAWKYRPKYASQ